MVIAVDDEVPVNLIRLFNEPEGKALLKAKGIAEPLIASLDQVGISGAANLACAIKFAKYYELDENDVVMTVLTDSMDMYQSRLVELNSSQGVFSDKDAIAVYEGSLRSLTIDFMQELTYYGRKQIHNLKYYTWVEQQGKTYEEIQSQWYQDDYWSDIIADADRIDDLIHTFNARTGLLEKL